MMELNDIIYLSIGCFIGYRLGKLEINLDTMKKELDGVEAMMKRRNDSGFIEVTFRSALLGFVFLLTAAAAIYTGVTNVQTRAAADRSDAAVVQSNAATDRMEVIGECNRKILGDLLSAVNARAATTKPLAKTNIEFQQSFRDLMGKLIHIPPFSDNENFKATQSFFENQGIYIDRAKQQLGDVKANPLPTIKEYNSCVAVKMKQNEKEKVADESK